MSTIANQIPTNNTLTTVTPSVNNTATPTQQGSIMQATQQEQVVEQNNNKEKKQYRTKEQLEQILTPVAEEFGIKIDEVEHIIQHTLKKTDTRSLLELNNKELADRLSSARTALSRVQKTRKEGEDFKKCRAGKLARTYNRAKRHGIDSTAMDKYLDKYGENSLEDYLKQKYPDLNEEAAIEQFVKENFANNYEERVNKNGEDPEVVKQEIRQELLALVSMTSSKKEREYLLDVASKTGNAHVTEIATKIMEEAETRQEKRKHAEKLISEEYLRNTQKPDYSGDTLDTCHHSKTIFDSVDPETAQEVYDTTSKEAIKFHEKNKEIIEQVKIKIANNEELTEEEQEIATRYGIHIDVNAGGTISFIQRDNLNKKDEENFNKSYKALEENGLADPILNKIGKEFNNYANTTREQENLLNKLNKLSDNKFNDILSEVQNSNEAITNKNTPAETTSNIESSIGFSTSTENNSDTTKLDRLKELINQNSPAEDTTFEIIRNNNNEQTEPVVTSTTPLTELVETYGIKEAIKYYGKFHSNVSTLVEGIKEYAQSDLTPFKKMFEIFDPNEQSRAVQSATGDIANKLLNWVENSITLENLRHAKLSSFNLTQIKDEKIAEYDEKKQNGHC